MSPDTKTLLDAIVAPPAPPPEGAPDYPVLTPEVVIAKITDLQKIGGLLSDALHAALELLNSLPKSEEVTHARTNLIQTGMWAERAIVGEINDYAAIARANPKG